MGFTLNVYAGQSEFPENTYESEDLQRLLIAAEDVLRRSSMTGIHRIELLDDDPVVSRYRVGMSPTKV